MTLSEFKAWFEGFTESMEKAPTPNQWERIKERVAKIQTDSAVAQDKLRRAHQEDTASLLNVVKALKELKGMDLEHIMQQVEILNALSPAANPEKETVAPKQNVA